MSTGQLTILVAGDNIDSLNDLSTRLFAEQYRVLTVTDRATIITLARSEAPNLVLLDFTSCFDICRMLKKNFVTDSIPIIALLFPAEEPDRVAVLELGADDCIAKPYSFRELSLRVKKSLMRAHDKEGQTRFKKAQYYSALTGSFPSFVKRKAKSS